jgi:hypothetical protein
VLDCPLQAQLAIAIAHCLSKLGFQIDKRLDFCVYVRQFALEHGLHI